MKQYLLVTLLAMTSLLAKASIIQDGDLYYKYLTGNEVELTGNKNSVISTLTIPEKIVYNDDTLTVVRIADNAFSGRTYLSAVYFPSSIRSVGYDAFVSCRNLTEVHISDLAAWCAISFEGYALNCSANPLCYAHHLYIDYILVETLDIPEGVASIGEYAFFECTDITSVHIPSTVGDIGDFAFTNCSQLTTITVDAANSNYSSADGVLYNKDLSAILTVPAGKQGVFVVPESVTTIGEASFLSCSQLSAIHFPNSIDTIESKAFEACSGLQGVYISDLEAWCNIGFADTASNPLHVAHDLYYNDQLTKKLVLPHNLTFVPKYAFYSCSMTSAVIGPNMDSIGCDAFDCCSHLDTVVCYAAAPPKTGCGIFALHLPFTAVLMVPYESIDAYSTEEYTNAFDTIIGFSEVEEVTANSATIRWIPTPEATEYTISVYTSDTLFRQYHVDGDGNLIEPQNAPHHIHPIKKDTTSSTDEFYVLTMDGLDEATDYVYTITGTNSAQQQVYHEEGSFRTTENSEGFLDTFADDPDKPRKTLRNGQILILRGDKTYTLTGTEAR